MNIHRLATFALLFLLAGCAGLANRQLAGNLSAAIVNQDDPQTVRAGAPAFLLLVDGLVEDSPQSTPLLLAGARLYGAYAGAFVDELPRQLRLTDRARGYAERALCESVPLLCDANDFTTFEKGLTRTDADDVPVLYVYGTTLAGWVQARHGDWSAVAVLPRIEATLERVLALQEDYEDGRAHLYLGVIDSRLPASLGGRPERARQHFDRALELSDGRDLMAMVYYADRYARLVFDRALYERLLNQALQREVEAPGLTLSNVLAQQRARRLLDQADDYFGE